MLQDFVLTSGKKYSWNFKRVSILIFFSYSRVAGLTAAISEDSNPRLPTKIAQKSILHLMDHEMSLSVSKISADDQNIKKGKTRSRLDSQRSTGMASKRCLFVPGYKVLLPRGPRRLGATAVIDFFFFAKTKFWRWRHLGWIGWPHAMQSGLTGSRTKDALLSMSYREKHFWCLAFILRRH